MVAGNGHDQLIGLRLADLHDYVLVAAATPAMLERQGCELRWGEPQGPGGSGRRLAGLGLPFGKDIYDLARILARLHPETPVLLCPAPPDSLTDLRAWIPLAAPVDPDLQVGKLGNLL